MSVPSSMHWFLETTLTTKDQTVVCSHNQCPNEIIEQINSRERHKVSHKSLNSLYSNLLYGISKINQ